MNTKSSPSLQSPVRQKQLAQWRTKAYSPGSGMCCMRNRVLFKILRHICKVAEILKGWNEVNKMLPDYKKEKAQKNRVFFPRNRHSNFIKNLFCHSLTAFHTSEPSLLTRDTCAVCFCIVTSTIYSPPTSESSFFSFGKCTVTLL